MRFDDVRFGYTPREPVLDGFDLRGRRRARPWPSSGGSGSGKSTVAAPAARFYDVAAGRGHRSTASTSATSTFESLRRQVGVVFEDAVPLLGHRAVEHRLRPARRHRRRGRGGRRLAEADGFIAALPDGYDTVVGERGLTPVGRPAPAHRAWPGRSSTDPRILILDDATSSIDATTEEEIHATLRQVMAGRTTLLVAHRRSTLRLADRIVLVDDGRVVDQGTHDELLAPLAALPRPARRARGRLDRGSALRGRPGRGLVAGAGPGCGRTSEADGRAEGLEPRRPRARPASTAGRGGGGRRPWPCRPTPELLAALATLPPADDDPDVDVAAEAAGPAGRLPAPALVQPRTGLRSASASRSWCSTPVLTLLGPVLVRLRHRPRRRARRPRRCWLAAGAVPSLAALATGS